MAKYSIEFKASVWKDLDQVPKIDRRRILKRIERLADDPRPPGSKKLSASERYRVRQGVYRILYSIEDRRLVVVVVKVGHRRKVSKR
ncbi:MAG: type II toxin-antitoxin system RelE/ParE family toxin [Pyrinomonadaceae bacterium]